MRIIALVLLLTACSPEGAEPPTERLAYAGEGRDRGRAEQAGDEGAAGKRHGDAIGGFHRILPVEPAGSGNPVQR